MNRYLLLLLSFLIINCSVEHNKNASTVSKEQKDINPAAKGFNLENSDSSAIDIADKVMEAMGGRQAWDETRYLAWNFFGFRHLLWDKQTGDVRISMKNDSTVYLVNVNDNSGQVKQDGEIYSHPDSLSKYLERAKNIWINDSYWLVMPYKLKDSGVSLKYVKEDTMIGGVNANVLQLTFEEVGKTPENKYWVYVNKSSNLVEQWDYFRNATDSIPRLSTPWGEWKKMGNIMLSEDRGERDLSDVKVLTEVPENVFSTLESIDLSITKE